MKELWRFTVNLASDTYESNEEQFQKELYSIVGEKWYVIPHFFDWDRISSYWAIVIETDNIKDIWYIESVYWYTPTLILKDKQCETYNIVFDLDIWIPKGDYETVSDMLCFIYWGISKIWYFYKNNVNYVDTIKEWDNKFSGINFIKTLNSLLNDWDTDKLVSKRDFENILKINQLPIKEIAKDLWRTDDLFDDRLNISPKYWRPYDYVLNVANSISEAKEFMNKNYWTNFSSMSDLAKFCNKWERIIEWTDFFTDDLWYYTLVQWEKKRLTDFFVNVHYRVKKPNEVSYIISLTNPKTSDTSKKTVWTNTSSKSVFVEFLHKLWNFHFTWGQSFIANLHSKLSDFKDIPEIDTILWYWFQKEEGVVVFENWIFDIQQKIFTEKINKEEDFMFNYNWKWYMVIDKHGNSLSNIFTWLVPKLNWKRLIEVSGIIKFLDSLYNDYSGRLMLMLVLWNMGYWLFWDTNADNQRFPVFFVRGLSWSGKTTYTEIMQRMWWLHKAARSFQQTSNFTISIFASYLKYMPLFLSEFRDKWSDVATKWATIRSIFDATGQAKGRPDQSIVKYDYTSTVVIDWQEMFQDEAIRTRSIQLRFLSSHKIKWEFNGLLKSGVWILDNLFYTYLNLASKEIYEKHIAEWRKEFEEMKTSSSRIIDNLVMIYAWCMALDEKNKDLYLDVLRKVGKFQNDDMLENGDTKQILNTISKFLEQSNWFNDVYVSKDSVVISWNAFNDYINQKRIDMSLKIDTYKEHLSELWFHLDNAELDDRMVYWLIIPKEKIPKEFLVHPTFYQVYKITKRNLWQ